MVVQSGGWPGSSLYGQAELVLLFVLKVDMYVQILQEKVDVKTLKFGVSHITYKGHEFKLREVQ